MKQFIFLIALSAGIAPSQSALAQERVRMALSVRNVVFLPFYYAKDTRIFDKHGMNVELIQMRSDLQLAGLVSGEIDYTPAIGPATFSVANGAPIKGVAAELEIAQGSEFVGDGLASHRRDGGHLHRLVRGIVRGRGIRTRIDHADGGYLAGLDLDRTARGESGRQVGDVDADRPFESLVAFRLEGDLAAAARADLHSTAEPSHLEVGAGRTDGERVGVPLLRAESADVGNARQVLPVEGAVKRSIESVPR